MRVTTILVNDIPKVVVRPLDRKDLGRFLRNGLAYLSAGDADAVITHRDADEEEAARWQSGFQLHTAWGGSEDTFFGIPL
jgi:hypothetical protein